MEENMQLDRNALNRLLDMSDSQLKFIISKLAKEAGLDLSAFNISENDISSIRKALSNATDADIAKAAEQLSAKKPRRDT
jgi:DNA polymerase III delta subunit